MKIGYDAKRAFLNNTGLGNYSRWLIEGIAFSYPHNTYYLYTPETGKNLFSGDSKNTITVTPKGKLIKSWWRSKGIVDDLLRDGINVYHGLSHELPLGIGESGVRSVVTVHDLIFMRYPHQFSWINRRIYSLKVEKACRVADKIIAISEKTKTDMVELLNISPNKIEVIYQGCDPSFTIMQNNEQKKAVSAKYGLPAKFILSVGTIEERKNLLLAVKALKKLPNIQLVVIGKPTKYLHEIKQYLTTNKLTGSVLFLHHVEFAHLPAIYQQASAFIYPSRYEGFGIPVLEALNSGVPVIAATGSCLEEAGGPDSIYVHPDDAVGLAENINRVLTDKNISQKMITKGLQYAANFTAEKLTAHLMQLYKTLYHA